jgi:hypothetical protein
MEIGDVIYSIVDEMQKPFLIVGIVQRPSNVTTYLATDGCGELEFYEMEITTEKKIF